jgi:hypothetical protein
MGELVDRLNAMDSRLRAPGEPIEPIRSASDQVARAFRSASQRVNEAIDAVQEPGMPTGHPQPLDAAGAAAGVGGRVPGRRALHAAASGIVSLICPAGCIAALFQ